MRRLVLACFVLVVSSAIAQAATNPIVAAAKRTGSAKSMTMRMNVTTSIPGQGRVTVTGTGAQRGTSLKMSMRTSAQGVAFELDAVLLRERGAYVMYMRSPILRSQLPPGKTWFRLDLTKQGANLGVDFTSLLNVSQTFAPLEEGLVSTRRIGREIVAGKPATRYRAIIDIQRAARAVPAYGKQVAALERATGIRLGRTPYDAWVGSDGRIRRLRYSTPTAFGGARGTSRQTITFLSFDTPVRIEAPPRAQVATP